MDTKARGERWRGKDTGCGKWLLRVYVSTHPVTKKKKYKSKIVYGTCAEAQTELKALLAKKVRGTDIAGGQRTLTDYVKQKYMPYARTHTASVTAQNLGVQLAKYVCADEIGHIRVADVTTDDCDAWIIRSRVTDRVKLALSGFW